MSPGQEVAVKKAFGVFEILARIGAVFGNEDLAVMEWGHCAWIDAQVRARFLHGYF